MMVQYVEDLRDSEGNEVNGIFYPEDKFIRVCYQKHGWIEILVLLHEFLHGFIWMFSGNWLVHCKFDKVWRENISVIYSKYL